MEKSIINDYLNGMSISKLLLKYPAMNRRQITKILTDNNITIRGGRKKKSLTPEQITTIKKMIEDGAFLKEVANYCNLDVETMKLRLKELNLTITNKNRINRHINSNYFSKIDKAEKAYWLGFLFTDGSVDKSQKGNRSGRIRLQLQEKDLEILEQFKKDLNIESKILYDIRTNSTCCSVEFVDEQIFNDLAKYGIIPNKTYKTNSIPFQQIPKEFLKDFALGLFDGDGNFHCSQDFSTDVTIGFTAYHEQIVKDFQTIINQLINKQTKNKIYFTSAWHTNWRGRLQVLSILDVLYSNSPRFLKRKHDLYLQLKNSLN